MAYYVIFMTSSLDLNVIQIHLMRKHFWQAMALFTKKIQIFFILVYDQILKRF